MDVGGLAEVPEGALRPADVGGHPVVLVRLDGQVYALEGRCPHRGGPMAEGKLDGAAIRCPWHAFRFDVRSGDLVWPTGWAPLPSYTTRVRDGRIQIAVAYADAPSLGERLERRGVRDA